MGEWKTDKLGNLLVLCTERNTHRQISLVLTVSNVNGLIPQSENFNRGRILASQNTTTYRIVRNGDYAYNPARINVGSIARLKNYDNGIISPMYVCFAVNSKLSGDYLEHFLRTKYFADEVKRRLSGSVRECLNYSGLCDINITYPTSIHEQCRIAAVLSSIDDAIAASLALVDKYTVVKQGLMQDLLEPREGWITKSFAELGFTYAGLRGKRKSDFGIGVPFIPYMNIFNNASINPNSLEYVRIGKNECQNVVKTGDVLFTTSSETPEEVGMSSVLTENIGLVYLNSFCFGFRLFKPINFDLNFLVYALRGERIRKQMFIAAQGSTRHNLSKQNFYRMELCYPVLLNEQQNIAQILLAADECLTAERAHLTKLENVKRGLMNDLLTNRVNTKNMKGVFANV